MLFANKNSSLVGTIHFSNINTMTSLPAITVVGYITIALLVASCKDPDSTTKDASAEITVIEEASTHDENQELAPAQDEPKKVEIVSVEEELRKPENLLEFAYADFGPPIFTQDEGNLGKPMPYDGVAEKMDADWPVGNVRVLVIAHSNSSAQMLFLRNAGHLDPAYDYRIIWYFDALYLLDEVLKSPDISEAQKERPRKTREQLIKTMGSEEEVRSRNSTFRESMALHIQQNYKHADITNVGRSIMKKGQSR